jgi:tRNA1Val (adenine37-N6)-methyltransferase
VGQFRFKQFIADDSRCAMKIGTDAVLLGAWATLPERGSVLDLGCGCGVIAMMISQRNPHLLITAIDIDRDAADQASENVAKSEFAGKIRVVCADARVYHHHAAPLFDAIICNPPYFRESLKGPSQQRNLARHDLTLDYESFLMAAIHLLNPSGTFSLILPAEAFGEFRIFAAGYNFSPTRIALVHHRPDSKALRVMAHFSRNNNHPPVEEKIAIRDSGGEYTETYLTLTRDFYLFA